MSQSLDPRSVVRIALAFTALKHKPRDQSAASYLLDLQSRFPLEIEHCGSQHWRTYALELEKQLATLKAQRDADQHLLSELPAETALTSHAPPLKKKSKKNPTKDQLDPEWNWDQNRANWQRFLSSQYPPSPSLVAAHAFLQDALAFPQTDLLLYASRLTDAILRALDTINLFLFSTAKSNLDVHAQTTSDPPSQLELTNIDSARIALASPLLMYVLQTTLHALARTAQDSVKSKRRQRSQTTTLASTDVLVHVDKVIDHVLEFILLPLLRALIPLCFARLMPLASVPLRKASRATGKGRERDIRASSASVDVPKKLDVRTDVFALIGTSLEALDALPLIISTSAPSKSADSAGVVPGSFIGGIRDRLGLETIRELEALYLTPRLPQSLSSLQVSPPQQLATSSQAQAPQPTPNPTQDSTQSECQLQLRTQQRAVTESRAKRLERLAGTRAERVRALATRDAGWFLASTLNLCVTPKTEQEGGPLRELLFDRIGKLVRSVHVPSGKPVSDIMTGQQSSHTSDAVNNRLIVESKVAIDPVCQNMLLAVCERAMSHLVPF